TNPEIKSMADIIKFNEENSAKVMPYFKQEIFKMANEKGPLSDNEYLEIKQKCQQLSREKGLDATLSEHQLDAIIAPSGGPSWIIDYVNGDHFTGGSSSPSAIAGYPNITVPAGYVKNLPIGISFMGTEFQEYKLLKFAYAYEQATKIRKPPSFEKTI
ncbi:MAG: amidase family protein, partial [Candidatus Thorarchaeota archaeon]